MGETCLLGAPRFTPRTAALHTIDTWATVSGSSRGAPDMLTFTYLSTCRSTSHAMGW